MIYLLICAIVIFFLIFSFSFVKTYQLCGYSVGKFLQNCATLNLSFGDKNKLVFTKRIMRFYVMLIMLAFALVCLPILLLNNALLSAFDVIVVFVFSPIWIVFVHYILWPIEEIIKLYYIHKAKKKLRGKHITKIAITGSYGKTSTKNILTHLLEKQFKVCPSPKNYNTEMGITLTILKNLDDHDILIAEMGARKPKDIEKLTKIVNPDIGIITSIGNCHIESFKTFESIENTKYELAEGIKDDGKMFFGGSDSTYKLYQRFKGNKKLTCQVGAFAYAENIHVGIQGSKFDLIIDGKKVEVETKLLGKFNIDNIVVASAVAYSLGITLGEIQSAIKSLSASSHRLELIQTDFITILDDSYNSNEVGFKEALNVLSMFEGRKIVVSPGMVELGDKQGKLNFTLGGQIADNADYFIIMNETNKTQLLSGAISHGMKRENILFATTRDEQMEIIKMLACKGAVVLFENDLPDNYK